MVEMQVGKGHLSDVGWSAIGGGKRCAQRLGWVYPVHRLLAFGEALANPGTEQDEFAAHFEQQTIAGEINAIFRIWRAFFLPQNFGYNAEHRAPIQAEPPALKV